MREQITEFLATVDPMFIVAAIAGLLGVSIFYLYGGFIEQNYRKIKWFRRLVLPHISNVIRKYDKQNPDIDLSHLSKTETTIFDREHVFDLYLPTEDSKEKATKAIDAELIQNHFRPEVILSSIGRQQSSGELEDGNFVLTAPEKERIDTHYLGRLYDIFVMLTSKYQLHVRYFYDEDKHRIRFYAHHELNPYNPLYSKRHLEAVEFDTEKGVKMFKEYKDELAKYGVEIVE